MTENNDLEQKKEAIRDKHQKGKNRIGNRMLLAAAVGAILAFGSLVWEGYESMNRDKSQIVLQYGKMVSTQKKLKEKKANLHKLIYKPDLDYEPKEIKPYLKKAFAPLDKARIDSLDKAVKIVEANLEEFEKLPEIQEYYNEGISPYAVFGMNAGMGISFGCIPIGVYFLIRNDKRKKKELKALEQA